MFLKYFRLIGLLFFVSGSFLDLMASDLTRYEVDAIKKKVKTEFEIMIQQWQEELYFDLYDVGQGDVRKQLSKEEFAQRMVELKWKPSTQKSDVNIKETKVLYRNYVIIFAEVKYIHKINVDKSFTKQEEFEAKLEDDSWKFDLKKIVRTPF